MVEISVPLAFLAGIFTALGPCVFTVLPVTLAFVTGVSDSRRKAFSTAVSFIFGLSITLTALGVFASILGQILNFTFYFRYLAAFIAFLMGLKLLNVVKIESDVFSRFRPKAAPRKKGLIGAFSFGLVFGVAVNPCADPVLAGILALIAAEGNVVFGGVTLFIYSIGFGIPVIFASVLSSEAKFKLSESILKAEWINKVSGIILILIAFTIIHPISPYLYNAFPQLGRIYDSIPDYYKFFGIDLE